MFNSTTLLFRFERVDFSMSTPLHQKDQKK